MPKDVDRYYEEVKKSNPEYSDEQAYATAWSIYCKYKNPGSPSCKKEPSEYFKNKKFSAVNIVRLFIAREFNTPEALKDYLKDHPNADKSKHTVKKPEKSEKEELEGLIKEKEEKDVAEEKVKTEKKKEQQAKQEAVAKEVAMSLASPKTLNKYLGKEDTYEYEVEFDDNPKVSWKDKLKGLGAKLKSVIKSVPEQTKKFIEDESFRKETLNQMKSAAEKAPGALWKNVKHTIKEEVHEFKEAGHGVKNLLTGKKMNDHQKKALKTVSFHLALGLAAAIATPTALAAGPAGVGAAFAKGFTKHLALKCVSATLGNLHILEEFGHVGHGVKHFLEHVADHDPVKIAMKRHFLAAKEGKDVDPDEVLEDFIRAVMTKELGKMKDKDIVQALSFASEEE